MRNVTLILDDGSRFSGKSFGYEKPVAGEVVFNTAMTGYPESLTDPSYAGQLMTLTYPLVGNYGVPPFTIEPNGLATFMESEKIHAEAIIVSDYSYEYSHWNAVESLGDWLKREQIPGITGIDTRELTKVLREHGVMMGKIVFDDEPDNVPEAVYAGVNYVDRVSCKEIICYLPAGTSQTFSVNSSYAQLNSQFSTFNYLSIASIFSTNLSLAVAPTTLSTILPSLKKRTVGMLRIPNCPTTSSFSSTFILPIVTRPSYSVANSSMIGDTMRQGPHHSAQKSRTMGFPELTNSSKLASVICSAILNYVLFNYEL